MEILSLDVETYSSEDLKEAGAYRYCSAPDFEILLTTYSYSDGLFEISDTIDHTKPVPPETEQWLIEKLQDPKVLKKAWNAAFERQAFSAHYGLDLGPEGWECTMCKAAQVGLPLKLELTAKILKVEAQKDPRGKALIKYFTMPCKPTKVNGFRTRNYPRHAPEKWLAFIEYNQGDVAAEVAIGKKLAFFEIPETERLVYIMDQEINDRGMLIDEELVAGAIKILEEMDARNRAELKKLTGLVNPTSVPQMTAYLRRKGLQVTSLAKAHMKELVKQATGDTKRVLELYQELNKSSNKKYFKMARTTGYDGRARGTYQYYGAFKTGRWAGRLFQPQNLTKHKIKNVDTARAVIRGGDLDELDLIFGNPASILSQCIRTAIIAAPGHRLIPGDLSQIEARVIAWIAGETWRLEALEKGKDIYVASAAQMFKIDESQVDDPTRQKGKISELALGFGGGANALISMGALDMGLQESELWPLVDAWRKANKRIVSLWSRMDHGAKIAIENGSSTVCCYKGGPQIRFSFARGFLTMHLPSHRKINYLRAQMKGGEIVYQGINQDGGAWGWQKTYGGKLTENAVQALARDVIAEAMLRARARGYKIILHTHDEMVPEMPEGEGSAEEILEIMSQPIAWAPGLPLAAKVFETKYYQK